MFVHSSSPAVVVVAGIVLAGLGLARGTPLVAVIGVALVILGGLRFLTGGR